MQIDQARAWNKAGKDIAKGYADKLDDITNNCAYSKYFYTLLMFDGDNGTGPIPLSHLKYAMDRLSKRRVSISSKSPLKQLLGDFLSYCTLMFSSESSLADAKKILIDNNLMPTAVEILGTKVGAEFVAGRYDEVVSERMGKAWDESMSAFEKCNWRIMALGEWFGEQRENASNAVALIGAIIGILFFVIAVIAALINEGIIIAIITGVVLGVILYYGGLLALGILIILTKIIFTLLRWAFYNIYTLGIAILLLIILGLR